MAISQGATIKKSGCMGCHGGCGILVLMVNGKAVKLKGDPDCPNNGGKLCPKGWAGLDMLYHPDRLKYPLKRVGERGEGKWKRITWDEALETITGRMKDYIERYGANSISLCQGTGRGYNQYTARLSRSVGSANALGPGYICFWPRLAVSCST